ncbi:hypothetical protein ACTJJB_01810 [Chitinophaga sp. 22536]|uniref:hypothetical protein n=1 Tax=unclassified Chitinophaga TaxID=2619133 RepID=UPI003F84EBF1
MSKGPWKNRTIKNDQAKKIARSWASAIIWMTQVDSFNSGDLTAKDEQMIVDEMKNISAKLGRGLPVRTLLPDIIKSILNNEKR